MQHFLPLLLLSILLLQLTSYFNSKGDWAPIICTLLTTFACCLYHFQSSHKIRVQKDSDPVNVSALMPFVLFSSCFLLADHKNGYMSYLMVSLVLAQFRSPPASLTSSDVFCCCWHLGQSVILFCGSLSFLAKLFFGSCKYTEGEQQVRTFKL